MIQRRALLRVAALSGAAFGTVSAGRGAGAAEAMFASLNMFIPAGPGGGWDGLGRAFENVARQAGLVGSFQFENVGGAGGMVGLPRFISQRRGRPDAMMVGGSVMVGAALTNKAPFALKDVTPVARMTAEDAVIVVPGESPYRDIAGLIAALRSDPRAVPVAGGSAGGTDHIVLGLMLKSLGRNARDANFVAFAGGGPAQAALLGNQVRAGISGYSEFSEQIKTGRMRALATSGERRVVEGVPTLRESGIDVVATNWRGLFGAPGIRADARERLIRLCSAVHELPAWKEVLQTRGWDDAFLTGEAFEGFLREDNAATDGVLRDLGLVT